MVGSAQVGGETSCERFGVSELEVRRVYLCEVSGWSDEWEVR